MQPNNHQPNQPFSSNYLESIAAKQPVKTMNPLVLWGLIGGLLIFMIIAVLGLSSVSTGTPSASLASIGATLDDLQDVSESSQKNIQSTQLQSLNSNLTLTLTNTNRDIAKILTAQKISLKDTKNNKSLVVVKNNFDALNQRLEDARLNGVFDRTYAREITYALKNLHVDMGQLYKSAKSKELKKILNSTDESLAVLLSSYQDFNE